jgi:hypothetical protein
MLGPFFRWHDRVRATFAVCALSALCHSQPARADEPPPLQLSFGGTLLALETIELGELVEPPDGSSAGERVTLAGTSVGAAVGLSVGHDMRLAAHGAVERRLLLADDRSLALSGGSGTLRVSVELGEERSAPYLFAESGVRRLEGHGFEDTSALLGVGGGYHWFAERWVSIDPELCILSTATAFGTASQLVVIPKGTSGLGAFLNLNVSVWLGGTKETHRSQRDRDEWSEPREIVVSSRPDEVVLVTQLGTFPVRLAGRPSQYGHLTSAEVRVPDGVHTCDEAAFVLDDERLSARSVGMQRTGVAAVVWDTSTLGRVVEHDGAVGISVCSSPSVLLGRGDRAAVADYMRRFRELALRAGTWRTPETSAPPASAPGPVLESAPSPEPANAREPSDDDGWLAPSQGTE